MTKRFGGRARNASVVFLATAVLSYLAALTFSEFEASTHGATAIWPVNAMILCALVCLGPQNRIPIIAGSFAAMIVNSLVLKASLLFAVVLAGFNISEILLVWLLSSRVLRGRFVFDDAWRMLAFWAVCIAACTVNAAPVAFIEAVWRHRGVWTTFNTWAVGDGLGFMLVTPALLDIRHDWRSLAADESRRWTALMALGGLLVVEAPVLYFRSYELLFAILLIFVAIAFRLGRTVSALATLSTIILADVLLNFGHPRAVLLFGNLTLDEKLYAQVFLAGCALATIPMAGAIARQKALEVALLASRADALAASEAKSQFLANMSHEIRTPLTGVLGFAGLLEGMGDLPRDARTYVERIVTGGRALLAAVNDILDFSKLDADRIELDPHPFDPTALINEAVELIASEAARKGLGLDCEIQGELPAVFADSSRFRQVLLNLLGNAIKFTGSGGVILRAAYQASDGGRLRIEVADTGIGVPADRIVRLFQRFSQVDGSNTRQYGGTGLGLAICKGLVDLMGGEIGVESRQGEGSTFWFTIDAPRAQHPQPAPVQDAEGFGVSAGRILVVDDVAVNRELVRAMLAPFDFSITEAADGAEAVAAALADSFDLILMDLQMPGMDGLAATRAIRATSERNRRTRIIALSANVLPAHLAACREAGMDDHIGKPISPTELLTKVAHGLAVQDAEPEVLREAG